MASLLTSIVSDVGLKISRTAKVNTCLYNNSNGQDWYWTGHNQLGDLMVFGDGHGSDKVVNRLRKFDFSKYLEKLDQIQPEQIIRDIQIIANTSDTRGILGNKASGSTISIVIFTDNKLKISWLGDSQIIIYKNKEKFYKTRSHNLVDDDDIAKAGKKKKHSYGIEVNKLGQLYWKYKPYVVYNDDFDICSLTRSLGHGDFPYNIPETVNFDINNDDNWKLVGASDGVWDVVAPNETDNDMLLKNSAQAIGDIITQRWDPSYDWEFIDNEGNIVTNHWNEGQRDDIMVISWELNI